MIKRLFPTLRNERGTTIGELAIVTLITGLVGAMIMTSLSTTVRAGSLVQEKSASLQDVRTAIEVIERDLRAANPIDAIDPVTLYATRMQFSVYCANAALVACGSDHLRSVTYQVVGNQLQRVEGGVTQILVGPDGPTGFAVAKQRGAVVNGAAQPVFRYFDKRGAEIPTTGTTPPASKFRDCVRHVEIFLVVVSNAADNPATIELKTSGTLRNFNEVDGC